MTLLDTSGLLAVLVPGEAAHEAAKAVLGERGRWLTHSYVLAELVPLALSRRVARSIAMGYSLSILDDPAVEVVFVDESLHRLALDLVARRPDKSYSLCDAVSFVLMRDHTVTDALTTDHHFEQEGFTRLLDA